MEKHDCPITSRIYFQYTFNGTITKKSHPLVPDGWHQFSLETFLLSPSDGSARVVCVLHFPSHYYFLWHHILPEKSSFWSLLATCRQNAQNLKRCFANLGIVFPFQENKLSSESPVELQLSKRLDWRWH